MLSSTATPYLLRGFTVGGATLFPVLFGPYFADVAVTSGNYIALLVSVLLAVTIGALVSIQAALGITSALTLILARTIPNPIASQEALEDNLSPYPSPYPTPSPIPCPTQEALEDPFDGDARLDDISLAPFAPPGFSLWRSDAPQADRDLVRPAGQ